MANGMGEIESLVKELELGGHDVFWQGAASPESVATLESHLGIELPESYKRFLLTYGGGGVSGELISGIEDNDPELPRRGTVLGDTLTCREEFGLPDHLAVVYLDLELDIVRCLDARRLTNGECPVIDYRVSSKSVNGFADTFDSFFRDYLVEHIERPNS